MSIYQVNKLLYRTDNDAAFRKQMKENPEGAIKAFSLSREEHELRWNSFQSFQQFNRFAPFKSLEPPTRLKQFERLERGPSFYLGGTGTTVPQFLQVRSFSSLENFW